MSEMAAMITLASVATLAIVIVAVAALRGWEDWLELRKLELGGRSVGRSSHGPARGDLAELRARVRRLESIANGSET